MQQQCGDANPHETVYLKSKIHRQLSHSLCKHTSQTLISFSNLSAFHIHEFTIDASSLQCDKEETENEKKETVSQKEIFFCISIICQPLSN